jgi:putative toxin-antitoxin system antitoxin component (TIGR02293 family)
MTELSAIFDQAAAVFGSRDAAERWMVSPAFGLDHRRPIDVACTVEERRFVQTYLAQIEYGVYV